MSDKEKLEIREKLNRSLKESFEKMLIRKIKLGQSVVTSDGNGNAITISAQEAWERYKSSKKKSECF